MLAPTDSHSRISKAEMDSARLELLRGRIIHFATVTGVIVIGITAFATWVGLRVRGAGLDRFEWVSLGGGYFMGVMLMIVPRLRSAKLSTVQMNDIVRRMTIVILAAVFTQLTSANLIAEGLAAILARFGRQVTLGPALPGLAFFFILHTVASFVIPWRPRDAARAVLIFGTATTLFLLASQDPVTWKIAGSALAFAVGIPGLMVSVLRYSRFTDAIALRLISSRYDEVERELSTARRIHDRLFPVPRDIGPLRFTYQYEPMRSIGGDYLDLLTLPNGSAMLILIDVTGHGIPAALAVNRLHGEIRRVLAESPAFSPGQLIEALNRYIHATLSDETVFATAIALRIDPSTGACRYCNAGHPPAFLARAAQTDIESIDSTTLVLGVAQPDEFTADERTFTLSPGDLLILYTDGAIECRDTSHAQLRIEGLRETFRAGRAGQPDIARAVDGLAEKVRTFRAGSPEDDTLIAGVELLN